MSSPVGCLVFLFALRHKATFISNFYYSISWRLTAGGRGPVASTLPFYMPPVWVFYKILSMNILHIHITHLLVTFWISNDNIWPFILVVYLSKLCFGHYSKRIFYPILIAIVKLLLQIYPEVYMEVFYQYKNMFRVYVLGQILLFLKKWTTKARTNSVYVYDSLQLEVSNYISIYLSRNTYLRKKPIIHT